MTLVKCKECGHQVSSLADICPNCGAPKGTFLLNQTLPPKPKKKSRLGQGLLLILMLVVLGLIFKYVKIGSSGKTIPSRSTQLETALNYLSEIEEIKWVDIDDNNVYIGFDPLPSDYITVCKAAALHGNKTIDFGVHVWAIDASKYYKGWRPGSGTFYYETTARYGRIQD